MDQEIVHQAPANIGGFPDIPVAIGVWDWDLSSNLIFADESVANAFGLNSSLTRRGLPPEAYFSNIHDEDRQMIIDHSLRSIAANGSCSDNFRIVGPMGTRWVHSQGRCFSSGDNAPKCFVGLISEIAPHHNFEQAESYHFSGGAANEDLMYLCLHAKRIATRTNRPFLSYLLEMVIAEVSEVGVINKC